MTTYNHCEFIEQALESVLMQETDFDVEVILHDDCSTDGTSDVVRAYAERYPKLIRAIVQEENQYSRGRHAIPLVLGMARGGYVTVLEADDAWTDPQKLIRQVAFLENNRDCVMCYGNARVIDPSGRVLQERKIPPGNCRLLTSREIIEFRHSMPTATIMFRNLPFLRELPRPIHGVLNGDSFLYALLAQHGSAGYVDFNPSLYRQHPGGIYSSLDENQRRSARIHTLETLRGCIGRQFRPFVDNAIAEAYLAHINSLRHAGRMRPFVKQVRGLLGFSLRHRFSRGFYRDLRSCGYQVRRFLAMPRGIAPQTRNVGCERR